MQRYGKHHSRYLKWDKSMEMRKLIVHIGVCKLLEFLSFVLMRLSNEHFSLIAYLTANDYELVFFSINFNWFYSVLLHFFALKTLCGFTLTSAPSVTGPALDCGGTCLPASPLFELKLNSTCYKTSTQLQGKYCPSLLMASLLSGLTQFISQV